MAVDTSEIELHVSSIEKFAQENPRTMQWLLHNFAALATALGTVPEEFDSSALEASILELQTQIAAITTVEEFDPSALQAAIEDLQEQIDLIVIPPPPIPFAMPDGTVDQVLTHGPGGNGDYFFADPAASGSGIIYTLAQTGDLIPVNEGTDDEAILPEFMLTDDGAVMLVPVG